VVDLSRDMDEDIIYHIVNLFLVWLLTYVYVLCILVGNVTGNVSISVSPNGKYLHICILDIDSL